MTLTVAPDLREFACAFASGTANDADSRAASAKEQAAWNSFFIPSSLQGKPRFARPDSGATPMSRGTPGHSTLCSFRERESLYGRIHKEVITPAMEGCNRLCRG